MCIASVISPADSVSSLPASPLEPFSASLIQAHLDTKGNLRNGNHSFKAIMAAIWKLTDADDQLMVIQQFLKIRDPAFQGFMVEHKVMQLFRKWLAQGMLNKHMTLVMSLLNLLHALPMTLEALKTSGLGKQVNAASKMSDAGSLFLDI